jgi:hypothetical protein
MVLDPTPDEQSKKKVAKQVIAPKRRYFAPEGVSVEADSLEDAVKQLEELKRKQAEEEGDATK